ncbi:MAG: sensor histidine kinase [Actinomycetota bacterium]
MESSFLRGGAGSNQSQSVGALGRVDLAAIYARTRLWTALGALVVNTIFAVLEGRPELWILPAAAVPTLVDALRRPDHSRSLLARLLLDTTGIGLIITTAGLAPVSVAWGILIITAGAVLAPAAQVRLLFPYALAWMGTSLVVSWMFDTGQRWDPATATTFSIIQVLVTVAAQFSLVTIVRRVRDLDEQRNRLIGGFVHDMKNALTGAVGMAELLTTHLDDLDREEVVEYASMAVNEGREALAMTEDLLAVERAEAGRLQVTSEPVELTSVASEVLAATDHPDTDVEKYDPDPVAVGDTGKVRQIIRNLVTNADRYGGERLRVTAGARGDYAYLRVADDGSPIPESERERIFDAYQRALHRRQHSESVGLGLTISRHLARLMGGDLTYDHVEGWSTFELTLPLSIPVDSAEDAIDTRTDRIWLGSDGVLRSRVRPGAEIGLEDARLGVDACCRAGGGAKRPLLVYAENVSFLSPEARSFYMRSREAADCVTAVAILADISPTARILAGAFARFSDSPFPAQIFENESRALAWLHPYRREPNHPQVPSPC